MWLACDQRRLSKVSTHQRRTVGPLGAYATDGSFRETPKRMQRRLFITCRAWLSIVLALGVIACDPAMTPPAAEPLVGTFALVSVDGRPLPHVSTSPFLPSFESRLLADTLIFAANGTGRGVSASINRDLTTQVETRRSLVRTFRHARTGDRVVVDSLECGPDCAISPSEMRYTVRDAGSKTVLALGVSRYERVLP